MNYRLIADYYQRPAEVERFLRRVKAYNNATSNSAACNVNNEYFALWVSMAAQCLWIIVGGIMMLEGLLGLSGFLTNLAIYRTIGGEFQKIYLAYVQIQHAFTPLFRITTYVNLSTDLAQRKQVNEKRRRRGSDERVKMRRSVELAADMGNLEAKKIAFPVDFVPLKCGNVSFSYTRYGGKETLPVLMNMSVEIPQGAVVCVCGPQGHGKSTFLQLMGQVLIPDTGEVFVPPHLRVLHVSSEVYFIAEDIKVNLFFGRGKDTVSDAEWERGLRICEKLGLPDRLMDYVRSEGDTVEWMKNNAAVLSRSDRALLHITRALIYNPEVLVIHNPTLLLDSQLQQRTLEALRAFVDERGLEMPPESRHKRRPRTVLFSTNSTPGAKIADKIFLCQDQKLRPVTFDYVKDHFGQWENRRTKAFRTKELVFDSSPEESPRDSPPATLFSEKSERDDASAVEQPNTPRRSIRVGEMIPGSRSATPASSLEAHGFVKPASLVVNVQDVASYHGSPSATSGIRTTNTGDICCFPKSAGICGQHAAPSA
jgi:ABC-type lipoprotein export system ATPase subunit